jgi:hypothetical protein
MSHLHEAISQSVRFSSIARLGPLRPEKLTEVTEKIHGEMRTKVPDLEETRVLQERVAQLVNANLAHQITRRDLKLSCVTINSAPLPPASNAPVGDVLLDLVKAQARRPAFTALLEAYVNTFDPDDAKTHWLAKRLGVMVPNWEWRAKDLWKARIDRFALLNVGEAPKRLAGEVLAAPEQQGQILQEAGLADGGRGQSKFALSAFQAGCGMVIGMSVSKVADAQTALLTWNDNGQPAGRFPTAWLDLCRACLEPWVNVEPDKAHRAKLIEYLQKFSGGDPRTSDRKSQWQQVKDNAEAAYVVMMRWLTQVSVRQFLEVVDRSLTEPDARRMWAYRKAFWLSYLDNKKGPAIEQAWVAFGDEAANLSRRIARDSGDSTFRNFGRQSEKSKQHTALILKIGDLTIVDWSHSGKYNVWSNSASAPQLFKSDYRYDQLDNAPLRDSHTAPAHFNWQKKLAEIIEGRRFINEKPEWRPKGV